MTGSRSHGPSGTNDRFYIATTLDDAIAALRDRGDYGAPMAGATWIMRAPLRHELQDRAFVAVSMIDELRRLQVSDAAITIGACVTHAALAAGIEGLADVQVLWEAASQSANPSVREVATLGGNLCTPAFAAADLVPALLCLDAEVDLAGPSGPERVAIERFLELRATLPPGTLVRAVVVPRKTHRSAHRRLPLRRAGDYPVSIVSLSAATRTDGAVETARVAVGSVEPVPRRWRRLEQALIGRPLDAEAACIAAERLADDFIGRDALEAPGWYRVKVLPTLVRRAVTALQKPVWDSPA